MSAGVIPSPGERRPNLRGTPPATVTESDAWKLQGDLDQALYDDFCQWPSYRFGGEEYELGDSGLGEPFILIRKSDGQRFEVELGAEVREVPG